MERKKDSFVSIGETLSGLDGPVKAIREASPPARHHFTQADQPSPRAPFRARRNTVVISFLNQKGIFYTLPEAAVLVEQWRRL